MRRKARGCFAILMVVGLLNAVALRQLARRQHQDRETYRVVRVVDGDTVILSMDGEDVRVRLIGVDTPETVHPRKPVEWFGKEASAYTKRLLEGRRVFVELEPGPTHNDIYGRLLAYLYRVPDDLFINLDLVQQGYGHAYTKYPFSRMEEFRKAERQARRKRRGLWGD